MATSGAALTLKSWRGCMIWVMDGLGDALSFGYGCMYRVHGLIRLSCVRVFGRLYGVDRYLRIYGPS